MKASKLTSSGGDFTPPEIGTHIVTVVAVADVGLQPEDTIKGTGPSAGNIVAEGPRAMFNLELVGYDPESEFPTTLVKEVNLTKGEGGSLFGLASVFLGMDYKTFKSLSEAEGFDLELVLGKSAFASVGRTTTNKGKISALVPLPKGIPVAAARSELLAFNIHAADAAVEAKLPKLFRDKIALSAERAGTTSEVSSKPRQASSLDL